MKGRRTRKWVIRLGGASGILVLLIVGGLFGWQMLMTVFQNRYYRDAYVPIELAADNIGDYPTEHHLDDVPWVATREWYCQANSLAMIAGQHRIDAPTSYCSFLMGFTYGAVEIPGKVGFNPFTDPETGFAAAAPHLGLVRRYHITDDEALYLDALRYYLSQGYPVRVGLDVAVVYDLEGQLPHSEVLVGYDETGFYIYETVCMPGLPCEPCHLPPGEKGLRISDSKLLDAMLSQARIFSYPWRYSLTIFDEGPLKDDLGPIWERNGTLLIGGGQYGPRQGADAIERLAAIAEERGVRLDISDVSWELQVAVYARRSNATYLRAAFTGQADVERAADLFDQAADAFAGVLTLLEGGIDDQAEADQIAAWLRSAAIAEREVGKVFLARGQ